MNVPSMVVTAPFTVRLIIAERCISTPPGDTWLVSEMAALG